MSITFVTDGGNIAALSDETYVIPEGVVRAASSQTLIATESQSNATFIVYGTATASAFDTVRLMGLSGSLLVDETGLVISQGSVVVSIDGEGSAVTNFGTLVAVTDIGVFFTGSSGKLFNYGDIVAQSPSGVAVFSANGAANALIVNGGRMLGGSASSAAVDLSGCNTATLRNSGDIESTAIAVRLALVATRLDNGGMLGGSVFGTNNGVDTVVNSGTILGSVDVSGGADVVINRGVIEQQVFLGFGDDLFRAVGGAVQTAVWGQEGADTLQGGDLGEALDGGADADLVRGGGGDDSLAGGAGTDIVQGEAGDDMLTGDDGEDALFGGAGEDTLFGGQLNDKLFGGEGGDVVSGGAGRDILEGGGGADAFRFVSVIESLQATSDVIRDFERGLDVIDLEAVNAGELAFMGTGGFATGGAASVRYVLSGTTAVVFVDNDGDRVSDMRILLFNTNALDAADFVL